MPNNFAQTWQDHPLFRGLSAQQMTELATLLKPISLRPGQYLMREGAATNELYLVEEGELEIVKKSTTTQQELRISSVKKGETVGEVSALLQQPRSASVRAITACRVFMLDAHDFNQFVDGLYQKTPRLFADIIKNLAAQQSTRLVETNKQTLLALEKQIAELKTRLTMGVFLLAILAEIIIYIYLLGFMQQMAGHLQDPIYLTISSNLLMLAIALIFMRQSQYDRRFFGLTLENGWRAAIEGIAIALFIIIFAVVIKWLLIHFVSSFAQQPLLQISNAKSWRGVPIYLIVCFLQELMVRGGVQSSLEHFLMVKYKVVWSILFAALLFSAFHLYITPIFALFTFLPGIIWGILFYKRPTLVGVTLSHFLVGVFAVYVLGLEKLIIH